MKKVSIKKSKIQGKGLFAEEPIKKGETIGVAHQVLNTSNHKLFVPTGIIGKHYNHSKNNPNVENIIDGNKRYLVALKDIKPGTEITSNYFNTPDMEQPKKEWEDKLNEGGEPTDCPEGYYYDAVQGCVPGDEHHKWLREWYANRQMNTPEGQKILKKVQPEILERSTEFPPYVMTEELPKNTPAAYDTEKNVVLLNKFLPEKMLEESKTHENAHYLTSGDKFLNLFDKEIGYVTDQNVIDDPKKINTGNEQWDKNLKENFDYAVSPEEIYSKIMTLRKDAGFDPVKTITMQDLNDYFIKMKDAGTPLNPDIEELKAITKDKQAIVNLLNDLVYQSPTNQDIQITKRGGSIYNKGGSTNDAFQKKLEEVAKRLKVSKSDLLGIMKHESGLNPSAVNPYTRATGLIQFMPSTAKRMGTSVEALKNMSAIEQLDYVEKFYKPIAGKAKDIGDLYMFTFLPAVVGKPDNYVIGSKGSGKSIYGLSQDALYRQNATFDKDKKGYYTVGDVKARIAKYSTSKGKLKEDGSKTPGIKMETSPLNKDIPIEEYSEIKYNPVEKVEEPVRPKYTLEQAMFEMGAVETPTNTSQMSAVLEFLSPKRFNPQSVQTALTEKEIQQYVKGGYIVEELDDYGAGGEPCPEGYNLVNGECIPDQDCEDGRCEETDQIQALLNQGMDFPRKNVGLMWDVANDVNNPKSKYYHNAKAKWKDMGLPNTLGERLGMNDPANCMWAAGSGWQCLSDTKDEFKKLPLTAFESNDKFINAVNKDTIPFDRVAVITNDRNFDSAEKNMLRSGDILNIKSPAGISHAMTFSHYREDGVPIYLDSNGDPKDFNWNKGIWDPLKPGHGTKAYISRFNPEKFYEEDIKTLEEKARTNPTMIEKQNGGALNKYDNGGEKNKKPVFKLDPNFKLYPEKPLDLPYTPAGGLPFIPKLDLKNIDIKTGNKKPPVIPEWVKQKEEEAISKEILKNGMIEATRISRQGGLDKNKKDFIRDQVREQLGQPTSIKYEQDKKKVVQNKLDALDAAKVNKTPIDLKLFTDSKSDVDFVKTQEQEGWEAMNDLLNEMNTDANVYYDKVKKVSNKDRGDKSNRDLLREDLLNAMGDGTIDNLITNIKDKSGEWQYNQLAKKEAAKPWINFLGFSGLGLFDKGTKIGQFNRDFVSDPLNVMEELIWDQDYMVNRNEILRDPSHPLHAYYMKRTGMDKSPLSQALQYINPFSSAAESSVAIGKGEYGDAAYQFGEGLAKTVGIAAAVELAPLLGQYTIPGLSNALPGMTYAQGLNVLGAGYGVTQVPKTFKSIKNAFEKGDKESIRAAVNQTATNGLDFLGIGELKNVWNVPEKSIFYLAEDLTDSKNFAKEIKNLKESGVVDDFLYQERLDMWKDAMRQTQTKYADQGFQMKPADVLKNPDAVQYLKSTFEQMKAESIAYLESVEGRASIQKMLDEFPRTKRGRDIPNKYVNKFGEVFENNRADEVKRFINEANKDPKKFVEEFLVNSEEQLRQAQKELNYLERRKAELTQEYNDFINAGDQAAANSVAMDINLMEGRLNDRTRDIAKIKEIEGKISVDNPDFESLFNDPHFMYDRHFEPARATEAYRKMADDPRYHAVDAATEEFTVDDYINQLATQTYYDERQILNDAKIFEGSEKNRNDLQDLLAQTDPKDPLYQQIKDKIDSLTQQLHDDILGHTGSGNMWFNAFHSGNRFNNNTLIGRGFVPGTETSKPVVIAHEMAHGTPLSWPGFSKKAPWYDIFRGYGSQGSKSMKVHPSQRMGIHPVDEVLSEIDLFDAPPDFVQYKNMKPWYKGDGVNPYPSTVEEIEIGQGMPLLEYRTAAGQSDVTDAINIGNKEWIDAKDYFVAGSMGNEKVTFLAEVKQAMLDGGYGKRGNFKMKDLESFWKDYVQQSKKSSYGWDLRLLEIARPTTRTKKYMLKGLNMPGYESGGQVNHELGDELDLTPEQLAELKRQGYTLEKL